VSSVAALRSIRRELDGLAARVRPRAVHRPLAIGDRATWIERLKGYRLDDWQSSLLASTSLRLALVCARQVGKSEAIGALAACLAVEKARQVIVIVAPTFRQSLNLFARVMTFLDAEPRITCRERTFSRAVLEPTGSVIMAVPGDKPDFLRGIAAVDAVLIDEAAYVRDAMLPAVLPMVATVGGRIVLLSSPAGCRGVLHAVWQEGGPEWERVRVTALDCPRIAPEFIEESRRRLGDTLFRQEMLAEFMMSGGGLFDPEALERMFAAGPSDAALLLDERTPALPSPGGSSVRGAESLW
jgi:hypothetical protein